MVLAALFAILEAIYLCLGFKHDIRALGIISEAILGISWLALSIGQFIGFDLFARALFVAAYSTRVRGRDYNLAITGLVLGCVAVFIALLASIISMCTDDYNRSGKNEEKLAEPSMANDTQGILLDYYDVNGLPQTDNLYASNSGFSNVDQQYNSAYY
ncbi:hypothetical protein ACOME3_008226 [Neoechinorhynchus agilis]